MNEKQSIYVGCLLKFSLGVFLNFLKFRHLGQDIVKDYIEKQTKTGTQAEIWALFSELLANPKTASMMQ